MVRKESVETQNYVSRKDVEFEGRKSLEELDLIPIALGEPLQVKHMCDGNCNEIGFKFYDLAAIATEEGGMPHTINLSRKCYDGRRKEQGEEKGQQYSLERDEQAKTLLEASCGPPLGKKPFCDQCRNDSRSRKLEGPELRWLVDAAGIWSRKSGRLGGFPQT